MADDDDLNSTLAWLWDEIVKRSYNGDQMYRMTCVRAGINPDKKPASPARLLAFDTFVALVFCYLSKIETPAAPPGPQLEPQPANPHRGFSDDDEDDDRGRVAGSVEARADDGDDGEEDDAGEDGEDGGQARPKRKKKKAGKK